MAKYDVDVVVSDNPPVYSVFVKVSGQHIPTTRNADTNWEGTFKALELPDPTPVEYYGDGISNQKWTLVVTLTPSDASSSLKEVDYKKSGQLDNDGDYHLVDQIKLT